MERNAESHRGEATWKSYGDPAEGRRVTRGEKRIGQRIDLLERQAVRVASNGRLINSSVVDLLERSNGRVISNE